MLSPFPCLKIKFLEDGQEGPAITQGGRQGTNRKCEEVKAHWIHLVLLFRAWYF